jgi:hypothetical protein
VKTGANELSQQARQEIDTLAGRIDGVLLKECPLCGVVLLSQLDMPVSNVNSIWSII